MKPLRIGTRGSALALWQSHWVERELVRHGVETQVVVISTSGDRNQQGSVANLGAQGVFTKEIQHSLLNGEIDLAVHSLKDLPTEPVEGIEFVASPKRGEVRDALVSTKAKTLDELPDGAVIGTGSVRRKAQILNQFETRFRIVDIRGNVETRLRKVDSGEYDAVILAEAGLVRLGFERRIVSFLEPPLFLPAIGQGALGLEIRSSDTETRRKVLPLNDWATYTAVTAERSLLATLRGGCLAPVAALGSYADAPFFSANKRSTQLTLIARVLSPDGMQKLEASELAMLEIPQNIILQNAGSLDELLAATETLRHLSSELGRKAANILLANGAETLLRSDTESL